MSISRRCMFTVSMHIILQTVCHLLEFQTAFILSGYVRVFTYCVFKHSKASFELMSSLLLCSYVLSEMFAFY